MIIKVICIAKHWKIRRLRMKGIIIFQNRIGGEITFKITNEHLWERLYHELAFLAESGRGVSYVRGGEE